MTYQEFNLKILRLVKLFNKETKIIIFINFILFKILFISCPLLTEYEQIKFKTIFM